MQNLPQFTKTAIIDSFIKLAGRMQVDKITVKDIVDTCGVNRNTFYYYFQDVYALIEELFENGPGSVDPGSFKDSWVEGFYRILEFSKQHPKLIKNVYISVGRDSFDSYIQGVIMTPIVKAISGYAQTVGADVSGCRQIALFYCEALSGLLSSWIRHDMKDDPAQLAKSVEEMFGNGIKDAVISCSKV